MLILILGAFGLLRIVATHKDIDDVANIDIPLIEILTQIETNQLGQSVEFERAIRYANEYREDTSDALMYQKFIDADSNFRYLANQVDLLLVAANQEVREALKRTSQESQQTKLQLLFSAVRKLEGDHTSYEEHAIEVLELLEQGDYDKASITSDRVEQEEDQFNKQVEGVLMRHEMFTESLVQLVEQEEVLSMKWIVTLTLLFIILSLLAVYSFSYRIWRPLEDIRTGAERIGSGNLKARVKLRSNSITYDIVEAFNDMAEKLAEAQNEINRFIHFSYSTANDLKAPITNISSLLEMFEKDNLSESNFKAVLNNAKKTNAQLAKTVEALTEVNRVREELSFEGEELIIEEIMKEAINSYLPQIKSSNTSIKKDFSESNLIEYPRRQLRTVFEKLISNSLKYRDPERPLVIRIKTRQIKAHTTLIFSDNGLGFDSIKYREEIFKPYFRIHSHTSGTGLGLYIVKMIVDHQKGGIRVESEPKKGTTFAIRLS